jgi:hypothetical protein
MRKRWWQDLPATSSFLLDSLVPAGKCCVPFNALQGLHTLIMVVGGFHSDPLRMQRYFPRLPRIVLSLPLPELFTGPTREWNMQRSVRGICYSYSTALYGSALGTIRLLFGVYWMNFWKCGKYLCGLTLIFQ